LGAAQEKVASSSRTNIAVLFIVPPLTLHGAYFVGLGIR
jgi:hypothetical protein